MSTLVGNERFKSLGEVGIDSVLGMESLTTIKLLFETGTIPDYRKIVGSFDQRRVISGELPSIYEYLVFAGGKLWPDQRRTSFLDLHKKVFGREAWDACRFDSWARENGLDRSWLANYFPWGSSKTETMFDVLESAGAREIGLTKVFVFDTGEESNPLGVWIGLSYFNGKDDKTTLEDSKSHFEEEVGDFRLIKDEELVKYGLTPSKISPLYFTRRRDLAEVGGKMILSKNLKQTVETDQDLEIIIPNGLHYVEVTRLISIIYEISALPKPTWSFV